MGSKRGGVCERIKTGKRSEWRFMPRFPDREKLLEGLETITAGRGIETRETNRAQGMQTFLALSAVSAIMALQACACFACY